MRKYIFEAHAALKRVYGEGSYSDDSLNSGDVSALGTKLTYGVLENNILLDYILSQCVSKKPRLDAYILLKIGAYALLTLTDVPDYAVVSECVEVAKRMKDVRGASGFVNAVLKRVASRNFKIPKEGDADYLSVTFSVPQWFIDRLRSEYGVERAEAVIKEMPSELEHIRINTRLCTLKDVTEALDRAGESYSLTDVGGISVRVCDEVKHLFSKGWVTYQSPSSMLAVMALGIREGSKVLDMCSAPGGKAVYISELDRTGSVVACELYPFRLKQIEGYAARMQADNVLPVLADGTKFNAKFKDAFDTVLVDAPCSCFGTYKKHPDVFMRRRETDMPKLAATQKTILNNAAAYVKKGGILVYSTCTLFDEENSAVINGLIGSGAFELEPIDGIEDVDGGRYKNNVGVITILPHGIYDGFYIAKMRRKK